VYKLKILYRVYEANETKEGRQNIPLILADTIEIFNFISAEMDIYSYPVYI
jgi:hypothetical protein